MARRLGALLTLLRERKGLSQKEVAEQLCELSGLVTVSRHELSRWERENRIPSDFWLGWLSKVLEEPLSALEEARARSKGAERVAETARPRTKLRNPAPSQPKQPLATVSLTFEHQSTSVQLTGAYEQPEQAWAAIRMFERMVASEAARAGGEGGAPTAAKTNGATVRDAGNRAPKAPGVETNGSSPPRTPMGVRYTKGPGC